MFGPLTADLYPMGLVMCSRLLLQYLHVLLILKLSLVSVRAPKCCELGQRGVPSVEGSPVPEIDCARAGFRDARVGSGKPQTSHS